TSYLVDSNFTENELGERWRKVRDEWRTNLSGTTDDEGRFSFKGFYGKYLVSYKENESCFTDTIYFEPGTEMNEIEVNLTNGECLGVKYSPMKKVSNIYEILLNGNKIKMNIALQRANDVLYTYIFSVDGKCVTKIPFDYSNKNLHVKNLPKGCYFVTVGNGKNMINSKKVFNIR
ncbi:MAG: T9SS type A sorting domain-containing protein, partial [Chitinispirillaceae bacterium]|nr:T9SS type A sorting domain-containing protein [Chitinispirillaceae bacterium]